MRIENHTRYDTAAIRAAVIACHNHLAKTEGRLPQWARVRVEVVYARTAKTSGCAFLRGTYMKLRLMGPRPIWVTTSTEQGAPPGTPIEVAAEQSCPHCGSTDFRAGATLWAVHECRTKRSAITPVDLAALIVHELRHLYGQHHSKMPGYRGAQIPGAGYSTGGMFRLEQRAAEWASAHPAFPWTHLPERAEKRVERDVVSERYASVCEREKAWASKLKRAENALRKVRRQKRYYETKMAARGKK